MLWSPTEAILYNFVLCAVWKSRFRFPRSMARHDKKSHADCHSLGLGAFVELHMPLMDVEELKIGDVLEGLAHCCSSPKMEKPFLTSLPVYVFLFLGSLSPKISNATKALTNGCEASSATRVVRISAWYGSALLAKLWLSHCACDHRWLDWDCPGWRASIFLFQSFLAVLDSIMHTYVHRSFRCLCPNKLHRTSWWNLCRRGLAGCKLRDYPVDGRWTLTTRADFRCHGRTWQVGPKVESRFGLLRFFEIPC